MKILNTQQIRETDQATIKKEPISSIDLMERASKAFFDTFKRLVKKQEKVMVFCGMGNNGGDGLAVARMLASTGYDVSVYKVCHSEKSSEDFSINESRYLKLRKAKFTEVKSKNDLPAFEEGTTLIDAMFGSGLSRPLEGFPAEVVKHINDGKSRVVALDMPSGLMGEDNTNNTPETIVKADYTFTFQLPKLSFLLPENAQFVGNWQVVDIGLDKDFIQQTDTPHHFLQKEDLQSSFRYRNKFDHKNTYGHALILAGSYGKSGAAVLASKAALQVGAGLVTVHLPRANYLAQQISCPECMVSVDEDEEIFTGIKDISKYAVVGAGPGLGMEKQTQNGLKLLIQNSGLPLVLDADALNILSENPTWLSFLPAGSILTPHVGEFNRLAGQTNNGWERIQKGKELAFRFRCYIVLKGAHTAIITPDRQVIFNSTGNPGMATAGAGDVLTGMITGILAQGYSPFYSALAGVYLHGLAGDMAARRKPPESLVAGDILHFISKAIQKTFY